MLQMIHRREQHAAGRRPSVQGPITGRPLTFQMADSTNESGPFSRKPTRYRPEPSPRSRLESVPRWPRSAVSARAARRHCRPAEGPPAAAAEVGRRRRPAPHPAGRVRGLARPAAPEVPGRLQDRRAYLAAAPSRQLRRRGAVRIKRTTNRPVYAGPRSRPAAATLARAGRRRDARPGSWGSEVPTAPNPAVYAGRTSFFRAAATLARRPHPSGGIRPPVSRARRPAREPPGGLR